MAVALSAPATAIAQRTSARPASIALTVVVPPRGGAPSLIGEGTTVVHSTATAVDVRTTVKLADRSASRVEVRLAAAAENDSLQVWVRGASGVFERLDGRARVVAGTTEPTMALPDASHLQFHVESTRRIAGTAIAIPMEYRVTVGTGDQIAVWSFPSVIHLDVPR